MKNNIQKRSENNSRKTKNHFLRKQIFYTTAYSMIVYDRHVTTKTIFFGIDNENKFEGSIS